MLEVFAHPVQASGGPISTSVFFFALGARIDFYGAVHGSDLIVLSVHQRTGKEIVLCVTPRLTHRRLPDRGRGCEQRRLAPADGASERKRGRREQKKSSSYLRHRRRPSR